MIALIVVAVIILACIFYFYLKCPVLSCIATVFSAIIGVIVAFNFYETLASIMITKDYMPNWAHSLCFLLLFLITTVVIRLAADQTVRSKVEFFDIPKYIIIIISGIAVGTIASGVLIISLSMSPMAPKLPYERFAGSALKANTIRPAKSGYTDSFTAWLFSQISKGPLSSDKSFAVLHSDFIDQIHLNRIKAGGDSGVTPIAGKDSLVVPPKIGVRKSDSRIIIRAGLNKATISTGGITDNAQKAEFTLSQIRLIYKDKNQDSDISGKAKVAYPEQCIFPGKRSRPTEDEENPKTDLTKVFSLTRNDFKAIRKYGSLAWIDLVFKLPPGSIPVILQFKQGAISDILPKPVTSTDDIEQQLRDFGKG